MDNINNLRSASDINGDIPTQTISLSALRPQNNGNTVKIDARDPKTIPDKETNGQQTVTINPNIKKQRRSVSSTDDLKTVNPNDYFERTPQPKPKDSRDHTEDFDALAAAVARKKKEYEDFVAYATEADRINRENVAAGLDNVNDEEVQYLPDTVNDKYDEELKPAQTARIASSLDSDYLDDIGDTDSSHGYYSSDNTHDFEEINMNTSVYDPFASDGPDDEVDIEAHNKYEQEETFSPTPDTDDELEEGYFAPGIVYEDIEEEDHEPTATVEFPGTKIAFWEGKVDTDESDLIPNPPEFPGTKVAFWEPKEDTDESDLISNSSVKDFPDSEDDSTDISIEEEIKSPEVIEELNITKVFIDDDPNESEYDPDDNISEEQEKKNSDAGLENLKSDIMRKIIKNDKRANTSGFKVSGKVVDVKDIIKAMGSKPSRNVSWPLTYAGRPFIASPLSGSELSLIADADDSNNENSVGITKVQAKIMFEHDMNQYRPSTVEAWAKTIPYVDIENIFLALYAASLGGANYIPYVCPKKCSYSYLSDNIEIESMLQFESDEAKKRFEHIKNNVKLTQENSTSYNSIIGVINESIAVSVKIPSMYDMLFEVRELDNDFRDRYSNAISVLTYIDNFYFINSDTQEYQPITWKKYPGDPAKSFKSKILTYSKIIKQLDDAEYAILTGLINSTITKLTDDRAVYCEFPEAKCPKCGSKIEAQAMNSRDLVFLRQRLVGLATTPTEK